MEKETKYKELGMHAAVLLQLHLEKPSEYAPEKIVGLLFDKFENLELEEDPEDRKGE